MIKKREEVSSAMDQAWNLYYNYKECDLKSLNFSQNRNYSNGWSDNVNATLTMW